MRIVLDLQACQSVNRHGRAARHALGLTQALLRLGSAHDIRILLNGALGNIDEIRAALGPLIAAARIMVFDIPAPVAGKQAANAWRQEAAERLRQHFLSGMAPDIVHVFGHFDGLDDDAVSSLPQSGSGFQSSVSLHGLQHFSSGTGMLAEPHVRHWHYRKLQALKSADLLVTISASARSEAIALLDLAPDRIITIGTAVACLDAASVPAVAPQAVAELKARLDIRRRFVMHLCDTAANTELQANADGVIRAFALLPAPLRRTLQLVIAGGMDDDSRARLGALAQRAGLVNDDLVFAGVLAEAQCEALLGNCALAVVPALHDAPGLLALQVMSCGAPVIGAANTAAAEQIGMAEAMYDAADVRSIVSCMQRVLTDEDFCTALRANGAQRAAAGTFEASARRLLSAFEQRHDSTAPGGMAAHASRRTSLPRLAYISPLPPQRSGIADYSAQLLPELARHYAIDVIIDQARVDDPWITANFPVRTVEWFDAHAHEFERIVYHFGNSDAHRYMFPLLARHPGIVVLHDFYLSGALDNMDRDGTLPGSFPLELFKSHGYTALIDERRDGRNPSIWKYPCNQQVLEQATGVIVHSRFSMALANRAYGPGTSDAWEAIPLLRKMPARSVKAAARQRLGISEETFLTCSFGMLGPTKLNDRLLTAWLASPLAQDERCMLMFVGETDPGQYGENFAATITASGCAERIRITGFTAAASYDDALHAADTAVQLRSMTRGETSAAILDCLAYGLPTIVNANGSAAELPDAVVLRLPDEFAQEELAAALGVLHADAALRARLSAAATSHMQALHHPARVGQLYQEAIERLVASDQASAYRRLVTGLMQLEAIPAPDEQDLIAVAASIAANRHRPSPKQIFVDISAVASVDIKTGIQRVVRSVLRILLTQPPAGYRIEPVYHKGDHYVYARAFTAQLFELTPLALEDAPIDAGPGDIFLGLDLFIHGTYQNQALFEKMRDHGVRVYFVVYDILPMLRPDVFPPHTELHFGRWLETVITVSEGVACISQSVAKELASWVEQHPPSRQTPLKIGHFHLGADIDASVPSFGLPPEAEHVLEQVKSRPTILMVGTIEPRKGHAQALAAFELLWKQGVEVNLVIVGKDGWMVDKVVARLRKHSQAGKHLFWQEGASDEMLMKLYDNASALLAASEGEGFGLPLIEAAQHGLPIIARGLPVFREVAQDNAFYFDGMSAGALATAVREWLLLHDAGKAPSSGGMQWLNWEQSVHQLLKVILPQP